MRKTLQEISTTKVILTLIEKQRNRFAYSRIVSKSKGTTSRSTITID
jgi:hypothetical protein